MFFKINANITHVARCEALPRDAPAAALPPKRTRDGRAARGGVTRQSHVTSLLFFHTQAHTSLQPTTQASSPNSGVAVSFEGKIVWITGASSGIGEALAYALATRGARLILSARRAARLREVQAACAHPDRHVVLSLDLADAASLEAAARQALDAAGPIDVLINNGGVSQRALALDTELAVDRRIMDVNYFGAVALTKAVLPSMLARGAGHLVVVTSVVGKFGSPWRSAYSASKHALHGFFDALRAEVHQAGLRVTLVCPGFVRTDVSLHALTGDGTPQGTMDAGQQRGLAVEVCAARIVRAIEREKDEVYFGGKEAMAVYLKRFWPGLFNRIIRRAKVT